MFKKIVCILLTVMMMATFIMPSFAEGEATEFPIYYTNNASNTSDIEIASGGSIAVQINVTTAIRRVGVYCETGGKGKTINAALYAWNKNVNESQKGNKLGENNISDWVKADLLGVYFSGDGMAAGEYLLVLTYTEGEDELKFTWYNTLISGVTGYVNNYSQKGCCEGTLETVAAVENPFTMISSQEDYAMATCPPEPELSEDSAISTLNVDSTTWAMTDGLGRTATEYSEAGNSNDKLVGMFYWTWHLSFKNNSPVNLTTLFEEYPDARNDYDNAIWKKNTAGAYFWNEPLWGYYVETDDYVLRKHAEMLADAGVDFVVFDCTNGDYVWEPAYMNLLKVWEEARADGVNTPKIAFMLQFSYSENTLSSLKQLYEHLYKKGLYQDLWFYLDGKPLILAHDSGIDTTNIYTEEAEIANFFTFRYNQASYFVDDSEATADGFGWLSAYPQTLYKAEDGHVVMTTVGVCQNADYTTNECSAQNGAHNMGRSYTAQENYQYTYSYKGQSIVVNKDIENSKLYGLNFQEQWDYAIANDPDMIFVTGWNEWIAGRYETWGGVENGFPDQCDDENSRDIEPSKGDLKDYYYCQLVSNIRKYKGMSVPVSQTKSKTIDITAGTDQWNDEKIVTYNHYAHNTLARDNDGWRRCHYTSDACRNDFVTSKVSYDKDNIYFYVETLEDITAYTDSDWMRLLLDTVPSTEADDGWEGYEYILNRTGATDSELVLEKFNGGWNFETVGNVKYTVSGNVMQVEIPKSMLGLTDNEIKFNFKWCDNNLTDGDIMTLYTDGDAAPGGRFTFAFSSKATKKIREGCNSNISCTGAVFAVLTMGAMLSIIRRRKVSAK